MSSGEIIFILFVALMVFGADKIPEIARTLGKGMRQLKDATNAIKSEIQKSAEDSVDKTTLEKINHEIDSAKESITDAADSVKREL